MTFSRLFLQLFLNISVRPVKDIFSRSVESTTTGAGGVGPEGGHGGKKNEAIAAWPGDSTGHRQSARASVLSLQVAGPRPGAAAGGRGNAASCRTPTREAGFAREAGAPSRANAASRSAGSAEQNGGAHTVTSPRLRRRMSAWCSARCRAASAFSSNKAGNTSKG